MEQQTFDAMPNALKDLFKIESIRAGDLDPDAKLVLFGLRKDTRERFAALQRELFKKYSHR